MKPKSAHRYRICGTPVRTGCITCKYVVGPIMPDTHILQQANIQQDSKGQVRRGEAILQEMYLNRSQMRWICSYIRDQTGTEEITFQVTLTQRKRGPDGEEYLLLLQHGHRSQVVRVLLSRLLGEASTPSQLGCAFHPSCYDCNRCSTPGFHCQA
jgi:hypothetical protein